MPYPYATAATGIRRGCGKRKEGGIYLESGTSAVGGLPIWFFLVDPPKHYTVTHAVGVEIVEVDGIFHVVDYVGKTDYPFPADVIEEVAAYGASRKVSQDLDFSRLDHRNRLFLVHQKGLIKNPAALRNQMSIDDRLSLRDRCALYRQSIFRLSQVEGIVPVEEHFASNEQGEYRLCNRDHYATAEANTAIIRRGLRGRTVVRIGEPGSVDQIAAALADPDASVRWVRRFVDREYRVFAAETHEVKAKFETAIILKLPITNIGVVRARDQSSASTVADIQASGTSINVEEVEA